MANITINNPGRVALVEMHVSSSYAAYGMYSAEARQRMFFYPPPHYQGGWGYYTPYLWYDGHKGTVYYGTWQTKIADRLPVPAPVTITMWGDWWPAAGTGTIYAQFRNDSTATIHCNVLFVVTEDSIFRQTPNGDQWHNHVARDYLPTQVGEAVNLAAGDSITLSRSFALDTLWNPDRIEFVTWIQDQEMQPSDSTIEICQGGILDIAELGIDEHGSNAVTISRVVPTPNPCVNGTRFGFTLPDGSDYSITLFDVTGRQVRQISGSSTGIEENVFWDLKNEQGTRVNAGVYLYRFQSETIQTTGKVVVQ